MAWDYYANRSYLRVNRVTPIVQARMAELTVESSTSMRLLRVIAKETDKGYLYVRINDEEVVMSLKDATALAQGLNEFVKQAQ